MATTWLQCPVCGADLFESDEDGKFWTDTTAVCLECATICWIDVDDDGCDLEDEDDIGVATVATLGNVADVGQLRCDGSCDPVDDYVGKPCPLNGWGCCPRAESFGPVVELDVIVGEEPQP